MAHGNFNIDERDTVIIVGGKGGLSAQYRQEVEKNGLQCRYYEDKVPTKFNPARSKIVMVVIMVTMVSHSLMAKARAFAGNEARIVYLRSPSVSSLRQTMEAIAGQV